MVLHELATNAAKYGALKEEDGRITVCWREDGEQLILRWTEDGGPRIADPPDIRGFGSTLAETMVTKQLAGKLEYDWRPGGAVVTMELPLNKILV